MEKLLKLASMQADQAEVFWTENAEDEIEFNDGKLNKADSSLSSGMALRVIKDGKMGLAHTRNLLDREALVRQALISAESGVQVNFQMPKTLSVPQLQTYSPNYDKLDKKELIAVGNDIVTYLKQRVQGQVNVGIGYGSSKGGVMNHTGTNLYAEQSEFAIHSMLIFPGTGSGLFDYNVGRDFVNITREQLDELAELFNLSKTEIVPETRKMPVIFTPMTLFALLSRFSAASSPVSIYNKVSPLCGRIGEKIFDAKLTFRQDPYDLDMLSATAFDGEGTPTRKLTFVDKGIFNAIPTDLNYAEKLGMEATGNAIRGSVENLPSAAGFNVLIEPGTTSLKEMIAGIKEGILAYSLMGAHSGNVLNGDYSVGVSSGFLIRDGKIVGRVKDCLLSGNAYETLSNIDAIGKKLQNLGSHKLPDILCADVSVAGK